MCVMVLAAASSAEWKGIGSGDAAQVAREGLHSAVAFKNVF